MWKVQRLSSSNNGNRNWQKRVIRSGGLLPTTRALECSAEGFTKANARSEWVHELGWTMMGPLFRAGMFQQCMTTKQRICGRTQRYRFYRSRRSLCRGKGTYFHGDNQMCLLQSCCQNSIRHLHILHNTGLSGNNQTLQFLLLRQSVKHPSPGVWPVLAIYEQ